MYASSQPSDIPLFYRQVAAEDRLWLGREWLMRPTEEVSAGVHGALDAHALPMTPRRSSGVSAGILCCFVLLMVVRRWRHPSFREEVRRFFIPTNHSTNREERDISSQEGVRFLMALFTSIEVSLMLFFYAYEQVAFTSIWSQWLLIFSLVSGCVLFIILKQLLYHFVHTVFFEPCQIRLWRSQYAFLFTVESYLLFPVMLLLVYVLPNPLWALYAGATVILTAKFVLLLKCFSTFFRKIYCIPQLFAYLCALEIVPLLVLWRFFSIIIHSLTII